MLKKILATTAALLVMLAIVISLQPSTFHVERSTTVTTAPANVRALIDDFHAWRGWSPWEKLDPALRRQYGGAPSGVVTTYAWQGNRQIGEGRMKIEHSDASRIVIRLEFLKPFAGTSTATFSLAPGQQGTVLTWAMDGKNDFVSKAFHLVVDVDQLVGADFERGLAALKARAETSAETPSVAAAP